MINKNDLKGKYIRYTDKDGKTRTDRVVKIVGNVLTVKNAVGIKCRVPKSQVIGREYRRRGLETIVWAL